MRIMIKSVKYSSFLISLFLSTHSFGMNSEDKDFFDSPQKQSALPRQEEKFAFEKQEELDQIIKQYRDGQPVGLAVACGSTEMPNKIGIPLARKSPL